MHAALIQGVGGAFHCDMGDALISQTLKRRMQRNRVWRCEAQINAAFWAYGP
jgi:hypothetical protein